MKFTIKNNFFITKDGKQLRFIKTELMDDTSSLNKQCAAVQEYQKTHIEEDVDENILYLMNQFECFIAKNLVSYNLNNGIILDVGCGSYQKIPPYFRGLAKCENFTYVGLVPMAIGEIQREYLFIAVKQKINNKGLK